MSLTELMEYFFLLFSKRNAVFFEGIRDRIDLLGIAVSDLQDATRKLDHRVAYEIALARIVSRIFCVADHFRGHLPLIQALQEKFPLSGCSYCHRLPCICGEGRPAHVPSAEDQSVSSRWGLADWAVHLNTVYGEQNRERGYQYVLCRLFREVEELRCLNLRVPRMKSSSDEILHEHALELADILAWTIAAACLLQVGLEDAVMARYSNGCQSCRTSPCSCPQFTIAQINWAALAQAQGLATEARSEDLPR